MMRYLPWGVAATSLVLAVFAWVRPVATEPGSAVPTRSASGAVTGPTAGGVEVDLGRAETARLEEEVRKLQEENARLKTEQAGLPPIEVPGSPAEFGQLSARVRQKNKELQARFPNGAPDRNSPDFEEYVLLQDQLARDGVPLRVMRGEMARWSGDQWIDYLVAEWQDLLKLRPDQIQALRQAASQIPAETGEASTSGDRRSNWRRFQQIHSAMMPILDDNQKREMQSSFRAGF